MIFLVILHTTGRSMPRALLIALLTTFVPATAQAGSLTLFATAEDLATAGFTAPKLTKDGWELEFTRILATFDQVTAFQTNPPFMADMADISGLAAPFPGPVTVDLVDAANDDLVELGTIPAPEGHFNALAWALVPATDGDAAGFSLMLDGIARRDGQNVTFTLATRDAVLHACGEYIGDERKGFVTAQRPGAVEMTLHLDHLFGRADKAETDEMNQQALGFDPFAAGGMHEFSLLGLHLGHVGEGHCHVSTL
jgi:hypothetical protein